MEEFIVSARKYRPMTFDSVVGQQALTTTLKNAIANGKLAHAYLFCGPRGVGKTTCARIFAKAINCMNPQTGGDACGECESCKAFNEQRSMNIHELDAASNNSVDDIRELITQVQIPPQIGRYKVFIIDEVHMLSAAAFNAFLKTLEEPPSYVIFILATTEKHKILPTILSRCQVYDFVRMSTKDTIAHLANVARMEGYTAEEEALNLIAQKADGGMRDALSIFDQMASFTGGNITYDNVCRNLNVLSTEHYFTMTEHILNKDLTQCMLLFDSITQKGFDGGIFIGGMASHMRDLLMARDAQTIPLMEKSEQMKQKYMEQAQRCQPKFLYRAIRLCNECDLSYRTSRNKRLQVEICLIQLEQLIEEDSPGSGLGPAKVLAPIFQSTTEQPEEKQAPAPQPAPHPAHTPPSAMPNILQKEKVERKAKVITGYGPSLKKNIQEQEKPIGHTESALKASVTHNPLDMEKFRIVWYEFIQDLPREHQAIAQRMRDMRPTLTDNDTIQIEVNNEQVAQSMRSIMPQLIEILKQKLQNDFVAIQIIVSEVQQATKKYSKTDLYTKMVTANPNLKELTEALGLSIE